MNKIWVFSVAILMLASSSLASGSRQCRKTTKRCGTRIVKPLCGYGGQRGGQGKDYQQTRRRCGGCGGYLASK